MNGDVDGAAFTLYSHPRSRFDSYTADDLTGGNFVLCFIAHQKAERKSVVLAANGPDRRVGGIGPESALEPKWPDSKPFLEHDQRLEEQRLVDDDRPSTKPVEQRKQGVCSTCTTE